MGKLLDQEGKPLKVPTWWGGSNEEFAAVVAQLKPHHCSWPDGRIRSRGRKPCRGQAMENGRCRMHGGKAVRGPAHYRYKGDRIESVLPKEVAKLVKTAMADPDLLSIRYDVSLLAARQMMLMERLHTGESGTLWSQLNKQWERLMLSNRLAREAREQGDDEAAVHHRDEAQTAMTTIGQLIQAGNKDEAAWRELIQTTKETVDLKGREHARMKDLNQTVYAEDAMNLAGQLLTAVMDHVPDKEVRYKIGQRFNELLTLRRPGGIALAPNANVIEGKLAGD